VKNIEGVPFYETLYTAITITNDGYKNK